MPLRLDRIAAGGMLRTRILVVLLIGISAAALVVRLLVCAELSATDPMVRAPPIGTDMARYCLIATEFSKGLYGKEFYHQPFYPFAFLATFFKLFGNKLWIILVAQSLIGTLTIYLTGLAAGMAFGRKAALVAALLFFFDRVPIFYTPYLLIETLQGFWMSLIAYLSLRALRSGSISAWMWVGLSLACAILTRGNVWFLVPVLLFLIVAPARPSCPNANSIVRSKMGMVTLFLIVLLLPSLPFSARNSLVAGRLLGPSTGMGPTIAFGNNPEAPPGYLTYPSTYKYWSATSQEVPIAIRIVRFALAEPIPFAELTFRKLLLFWDHREIPNNVDLYLQSPLSRTLSRVGLYDTAPLIVLGITALFLLHPRRYGKWRLLLPMLLLAAYWLSIAAFFNLGRYRAPATPLLAILAGGLLQHVYVITRLGLMRKKALWIALALMASAFITYSAYDRYRFNVEPPLMRIIRSDGVNVDLGTRTLHVDNGPCAMGSWRTIEIFPGQTIMKTFSTAPLGNAVEVEINLPLYSPAPTHASLDINGRIIELDINGYTECSFIIPAAPGGTVCITPCSLQGSLHFLFDFQRNYRRTAVDNAPFDAELVCSLFIPKTPSLAPFCPHAE